MSNQSKLVGEVVEVLLSTQSRIATKYLSPSQIIRATRRTFKNKISRGNVEVTLTIGKPNVSEREFIRQCKKAGEPFPVKKIQLKPLRKAR